LNHSKLYSIYKKQVKLAQKYTKYNNQQSNFRMINFAINTKTCANSSKVVLKH